MWSRLAALGPIGRTLLIAFALVVLCGFSAAAYWMGQEIGEQRCVSRSIAALKGALDRERQAREDEQRAAAAHAAQLEAISERYDQAQRQIDTARRNDSDCDAYLARAEHVCARDYLYGMPARP